VGKPLNIADLGDHGQRKQVLDAFVAGQCSNGLLVARRGGQRLDLLAILRQYRIQPPDLPLQQGQVHLEAARRAFDGALQPGIVGFGPMAPVAGLEFVMQSVTA
jgi:hypothetical protein